MTRSASKPEICIIAGEASGDAQGALLIAPLLNTYHFWGAAGPLMQAQGVEAVVETADLAVMGVSEIVSHYMTISRAYKTLLHHIQKRAPRAVIFIDYPGFNLRLLQEVYALGVTTIYHIPPKVWSHGKSRMEILKKNTYLITSILPFETQYFKDHHLPVAFVGNPLKDHIRDFQQKYPASRDPHRIGLLPGSRVREIERILPLMLQAFVELCHKNPSLPLKAHIPIAPTLSVDFVKKIALGALAQKEMSPAWIAERVVFSLGNAHETMQTSYYAWVCSGTAALETAFFHTPMSALYKVSTLSAFLIRHFITVKYVTLVNLCVNKLIIPEFLQEEATVENCVNHAHFLINHPEAWKSMSEQLKKVDDLFPLGAGHRAAQAIQTCIETYASLSSAEKFHLRAKNL